MWGWKTLRTTFSLVVKDLRTTFYLPSQPKRYPEEARRAVGK